MFRNKNNVRPKKTGVARRRRLLEQKRRVLALGVDEEKVRRMTTQEIRGLLRHPCDVPKHLLAK
ncbi:MAG: hypothetical protein A3K19_22860 [Lentisphaerae bacterium RIFOXYB12_FULL_65_16]|nr:MAG: hypothetical protein A3K18_16895 [Lentisphaerae bacterium RIFOXYA12_64_32]OGV90050.1 MAG: hypothetical protein A3K19_22860 [Lentisphaerae bacterium RIFOXYB12_FULL_65_16]